MPAAKVAIIGAALDLGAGRRGVDMGPSAIRYAGLERRLAELGYECSDSGNVETAIAEATEMGDPSARFWARSLCSRSEARRTSPGEAHKRRCHALLSRDSQPARDHDRA